MKCSIPAGSSHRSINTAFVLHQMFYFFRIFSQVNKYSLCTSNHFRTCWKHSQLEEVVEILKIDFITAILTQYCKTNKLFAPSSDCNFESFYSFGLVETYTNATIMAAMPRSIGIQILRAFEWFCTLSSFLSRFSRLFSFTLPLSCRIALNGAKIETNSEIQQT